MKIDINLHPELYLFVQRSFSRVKYFVLLVVMIVGFPTKSFSKNYYVKSVGNDNNTGLSDDQAWRTIAKVNASSFLPGDIIFFNKGDIWRETLIVPSSGSMGQPIVFSSYGTGAKPIIQPTTQLTLWTQVGASNVWYSTLTSEPVQVFINEEYVQPAHWPTAVGASTPKFQYPSGNSTDPAHLTDADLSGIPETNLIGAQVNIYTSGHIQKNVAISAFDDPRDILTFESVLISPDTTMRYYLTAPSGPGIPFSSKSWMISENTWFYDKDAQKLYVWKNGGGNPGVVEASIGNNAIYSNDNSYVTLDGIHVRYSKEAGIFFTNWYKNINDIIIENCTSEYNNYIGIWAGKTFSNNLSTVANIRISNNFLDHNANIGIFTNNIINPIIADNTITNTGGLYPQLPEGGHSSLSAGIYIGGITDKFLIHNNILSYTSQNGIFYSGSPRGTISNNTISNTCIYLEDAGGIYSAQISSEVIIKSNTFTNTGLGIYFDEVSDGGTVEHNTVNGGLTAMVLHRAKNITARYNHFTGPFASGHVLIISSSGTTATGNNIDFNIINGIDNRSIGINIGGDAALEKSLIEIQNNVIVNCRIGLSIYRTLPSVVDNVKNNIFYNNNTHILTVPGNAISVDYNLYGGTGNWIWGGSTKATFELWKTASIGDINSLNGNPLFVSSVDFHLSASSPCINKGTEVGLITDFDGNSIKSPPSIGVYDYDSQPSTLLPVYQNSVVENSAPNVIVITYDINLANIVPLASSFIVHVNSTSRSVSSVSVSGTKVLLTLSDPVAYGNTVTVAYNPPTTIPLQTSAGGKAAALGPQKVTNNVAAPAVPAFTGASVENTAPSVIVMTYNLSMAAIIPAVSAFSVTVNSAARSINSVSVSGTSVSLTLSSPVAEGNTVTVAYNAPSSNPLQTSAGGKAVSFTAQAVINKVNAVVPPPVVVTPPAMVTPPVAVVPNTPPVAIVNYQEENYSGFTGVLNANGSYDANMDKLTFSWNIPDNIPVSSTNTAVIEYLAPVIQNKKTYEFVLTVSDGKTTQSKRIPVDIFPYQPDLKMAEISTIEATDYNLTDVPSKAVDGNPSTMWSCKGEDHSLVLKLKSLFNIKHIMLSFQPGQTKESYFDIYCSADGQTWDLVLAKAKSCSFSGNLQIFDFPDSKAGIEYSYIKLVGLGNSIDNWNYISEFRIFGYPHKNPADYEDLFVKIYPNPASEMVNILIDEPTFIPDFIKIVTLTGKTIYTQKIDPDARLLQIPVNFKQGIYIVQMGLGDITMFTQKLILNN